MVSLYFNVNYIFSHFLSSHMETLRILFPKFKYLSRLSCGAEL